MDDVVELLANLLGIGIYGTDERPRHPFWRNALRVFVFGGGVVVACSLLSLFGAEQVPKALVLVWLLGVAIVFGAEYYLGKPILSGAVALMGLALLALALLG